MRQLLDEATEAVIRARTAVAEQGSPRKKASSRVTKPQPSVTEADERRSLVPTKKSSAVKRKRVQSAAAPEALDNTDSLQQNKPSRSGKLAEHGKRNA